MSSIWIQYTCMAAYYLDVRLIKHHFWAQDYDARIWNALYTIQLWGYRHTHKIHACVYCSNLKSMSPLKKLLAFYFSSKCSYGLSVQECGIGGSRKRSNKVLPSLLHLKIISERGAEGTCSCFALSDFLLNLLEISWYTWSAFIISIFQNPIKQRPVGPPSYSMLYAWNPEQMFEREKKI